MLCVVLLPEVCQRNKWLLLLSFWSLLLLNICQTQDKRSMYHLCEWQYFNIKHILMSFCKMLDLEWGRKEEREGGKEKKGKEREKHERKSDWKLWCLFNDVKGNWYKTKHDLDLCCTQVQQSCIILHVNMRICSEFLAENLLVLGESGKKIMI